MGVQILHFNTATDKIEVLWELELSEDGKSIDVLVGDADAWRHSGFLKYGLEFLDPVTFMPKTIDPQKDPKQFLEMLPKVSLGSYSSARHTSARV